jgi:hypothetical protein
LKDNSLEDRKVLAGDNSAAYDAGHPDEYPYDHTDGSRNHWRDFEFPKVRE